MDAHNVAVVRGKLGALTAVVKPRCGWYILAL